SPPPGDQTTLTNFLHPALQGLQLRADLSCIVGYALQSGQLGGSRVTFNSSFELPSLLLRDPSGIPKLRALRPVLQRFFDGFDGLLRFIKQAEYLGAGDPGLLLVRRQR